MVTDQMVKDAADKLRDWKFCGTGLQTILTAWHEPFDGPPSIEESRIAQRAAFEAIAQIARASLSAALGDAGWQDISTAPTDGSPILGWSDEGVSYVCWHSKGRWTFLKNYKGDEWHFEPTKWMPHPAFPAVTNDEVSGS